MMCVLGFSCETLAGHYELFSRGEKQTTTKTYKVHIIKILDCICLKLLSKYLHMCMSVFEL